MPFAVTHILVPLILTALIRDFYIRKKGKKKFSLHYVLIAGIAGILPDIDLAALWILHFFGFAYEQIHKTFLHSLFIPIVFLILFLALKNANVKARICNIGKHNLKLSVIFLMILIGSLIHITLDSLFGEPINLLYPFTNLQIGINLVSYLPLELQGLAMPSLDAALLIIWLIYLELKHKISDFI